MDDIGNWEEKKMKVERKGVKLEMDITIGKLNKRLSRLI